MNTQVFTEHAGSLVDWVFGDQTDPDLLGSGFEAEGISMEVKGRTPRMSGKAAICEMFSGKGVMVRAATPPPGVAACYSIVIEEHNQTLRNEYGTDFSVTITEGLRLSIIEELTHFGDIYRMGVFCSNDSPNGWKLAVKRQDTTVPSGWTTADSWPFDKANAFAERFGNAVVKLQERAEHFFRVLPADAVAGLLVEFIKKIGGVSYKPNGGLYHLQPDVMDKWYAICRIVEEAAVGGTVNQFGEIQLEANEITLNSLRKRIVGQLTNEAASVMKDITENEFGEKALETQRGKLDAIRRRADGYKAFLSDSLAGVVGVLDTADQMTGCVLAAGDAADFEL